MFSICLCSVLKQDTLREVGITFCEKNLKIPKGVSRMNPYIEEKLTTEWPKEKEPQDIILIKYRYSMGYMRTISINKINLILWTKKDNPFDTLELSKVTEHIYSFIFLLYSSPESHHQVYTIMYVWDPDILTDKHYMCAFYLQIRVFQKEYH
jgi:hypothetical protein